MAEYDDWDEKSCLECDPAGQIPDKLYDDPRTPPLETVPCLCKDCHIGMLEEVADETDAESDYLRARIAKLENKGGE